MPLTTSKTVAKFAVLPAIITLTQFWLTDIRSVLPGGVTSAHSVRAYVRARVYKCRQPQNRIEVNAK